MLESQRRLQNPNTRGSSFGIINLSRLLCKSYRGIKLLSREEKLDFIEFVEYDVELKESIKELSPEEYKTKGFFKNERFPSRKLILLQELGLVDKVQEFLQLPAVQNHSHEVFNFSMLN